MVKYCNRGCQLSHRPRHKSACKKRAAELFDEKLFKQPPTGDDCPICFLRLPLDSGEIQYMACCGKVMCVDCIDDHKASGVMGCPFCRKSEPSWKEHHDRLEERIKLGDAEAFYTLGMLYRQGNHNSIPQDFDRAVELLFQAAELGSFNAHYSIATYYSCGMFLEQDTKKAIHHYQIAAMGGDCAARHNLGCFENENKGNKERALKHWMISASAGDDESLKNVNHGFSKGWVTEEEYEKTLRAYKESTDELEGD
ncbi:hypothetical protein ACHAXR_000730 [Thalassiosira sp. AJA248-18]